MRIRMIAFDLDGTLFDEQKKITEYTRDVLDRAVMAGMEIVPATGRPFCGVSKEIYRLRGVRYILTSNGAAVYEPDGKCVYENTMKLDRVIPLIEELEKLKLVVSAFVKGKAYMNGKNTGNIPEMLISKEMKEYIRSSRTCVDSLPDYLREKGEGVEKLSVNFLRGQDSDSERAEKIAEKYPEFAAVSGGQRDIELTNRTANKGRALLALGERLGISRNEIIAFGDSGNDVEMLRLAGIGVAMENGEAEAKAAADFVTRSNTEDGIAYALMEKYRILRKDNFSGLTSGD